MIEPKRPGEYLDWSREIPKELWEEIIIQADEPALITTCKLFKSIVYDAATTVRNLEANYKDRFPPTFFEVKNRDNAALLMRAKMLLHERAVTLLFSRLNHIFQSSKETIDGFEKTENLHIYAFTKILNEEYCANLFSITQELLVFGSQFMNIICEEPSCVNKIRLMHDYIESISQDFSFVEKHLGLSHLSLTLIPKEIELFRELEMINLCGNKIVNLPTSFGENWSKMESCDLSYNELEKLPEGFGKNWKKLLTLNINNNKLTELPEEFGCTWANLKTIHISSNYLPTIPPNFGNKWTDLTLIVFSKNKVEILPTDFGSHWKKLVCIHFGDNVLKLDRNKFKNKTNKKVRIFQ